MRNILLSAALCAALVTTVQAQTPPTGPMRDVDPQNILIIDTNKGRIVAELSPAVAPRTVERIKTLTRQGLYDNRTFFRVIDDFMAQTGDPEDTGRGGSALPDLAGEFSFRRGAELPFATVQSARGATGFIGALPVLSQPAAQMAITADGKVKAEGLFCKGILGMARAGDPDSANSQFYLMREKAESLNGKYAVFGRVLSGLEVVRSSKTGEPVPAPQDTMTKVRILADIPAGERPTIKVQDTNSAEFAAYVAQQRTAKGARFDICDLDIVATVQ